jgi:hypothetical protein
MLMADAHRYGGAWVFYVIAPVMLCGVLACLWLIIRGALGIFGQTPQEVRRTPRREATRPAEEFVFLGEAEARRRQAYAPGISGLRRGGFHDVRSRRSQRQEGEKAA